MVDRLIRFCLKNPFFVVLAFAGLSVWGWFAMTSAPVDAIPDISENQVVVDTSWMGRSPEDVEDQITYPLSTLLQAMPGVREVRSMSGFGMSRIYVVFKDEIDFYWARSRVLERLTEVGGTLPEGVSPRLGPDATALGQIYWYTVDGPYDLATLRSVQDWVVRYALQAVDGVAEVASIGGFVRQYQIDVDPDRMRAYGVSLGEVMKAVRRGNIDVGAKTIENTGMEYLIRGVGFVENLDDVRNIVIKSDERGTPVYVKNVAHVDFGPDFRRGALADDKGERVGGVVVMRFGANPLEVIQGIEKAIERLKPGLPDGVTINSFYDRTTLVHETIDTLRDALSQELIITVFVILIFLLHLRSSLIVASTLPIAVLMAFIAMDLFGVSSNIMSLAGIAIAIGTMVDMGIVMTENIYGHMLEVPEDSDRTAVAQEAATEVGGAILTAISTTIVSFIPVFFLEGQEGKLFSPLAWTKTFSLFASVIVALTLVPVLCRFFLASDRRYSLRAKGAALLAGLGFGGLASHLAYRAALAGIFPFSAWHPAVGGVVAFLVGAWAVYRLVNEQPTPIEENPVSRWILRFYRPTLGWILRHKGTFLILPTFLVLWGFGIWLGAATMLKPVDWTLEKVGFDIDTLRPVAWAKEKFPGIGRAFMPPLDEGSLLYMPSLLSQAGLTETLEAMKLQNKAIMTVPEVSQAVGKLGRVDSALDPAPIGMIETIILLKPRDEWRSGMTRKKLVKELRRKTGQPGVTPSWLQPIETRIVMLQSGIRASMAMKIFGHDRNELEKSAIAMEEVIRRVKGATDVTALRLNGKPYIEFHIDREKIARYGVNIRDVQDVIEVAIGGKNLSTSVEGRERYPIRVRYMRELRDDVDELRKVLVPTPSGAQIPITQVVEIVEKIGPASIRSENGLLTAYVMFNATGRDEVSVVEDAEKEVQKALANNEVSLPKGAYYDWAGSYKNQVRANQRLAFLVPLCLLINLVILYLNFGRFLTALVVFFGIPVAFSGGFILIDYWPAIQDAAYAAGIFDRPSFGPVYLTVAVWVGFIALFGIAVDDGVVIGTYLDQMFHRIRPRTKAEVRKVVMEAGCRRIRPCLMTTFTTIIALIPIFVATGRGSDVMQPMALPVMGGMLIELVTLFVVPCMYSFMMEIAIRFQDFDSERPLEVRAVMPSGEIRALGRTPTPVGEAAISIPRRAMTWFVRPVELPEDRLEGLAGEIEQVGISGLSLADHAVGDEDVAVLRSIPGLLYLDLSDTLVTDEACSDLAAMAGLQTLDLSGTRMTDAGLRELAETGSLQHLVLADCPNVSPRAVEWFETIRPACDVRTERTESGRLMAEGL